MTAKNASTETTMRFSKSTIEKAFRKHGQVYGTGSRAWDIPNHVKYWKTAHRAFANDDFDTFVEVYEELRQRWQVFRGANGTPWNAARTWEELGRLPTQFRRKRLSCLGDDDIDGCRIVLHRFADIKPLASKQPSIVAISKFLHFWNPNLFVIIDRGVVWKWVLGHQWLWDSIDVVRRHLAKKLQVPCKPRGESCDPLSYLSILFWGASIIRAHQSICSSFITHVLRNAEQDTGTLSLKTLEAAALEWFLLGLVEIPPAGVNLP